MTTQEGSWYKRFNSHLLFLTVLNCSCVENKTRGQNATGLATDCSCLTESKREEKARENARLRLTTKEYESGLLFRDFHLLPLSTLSCMHKDWTTAFFAHTNFMQRSMIVWRDRESEEDEEKNKVQNSSENRVYDMTHTTALHRVEKIERNRGKWKESALLFMLQL